MADDRSRDGAETLLQGAATWEPPDGFALRVIAAARSDERREPLPRSLSVIGGMAWLRAHLTAIAARRESTVWMLRQYWNLLRGQ